MRFQPAHPSILPRLLGIDELDSDRLASSLFGVIAKLGQAGYKPDPSTNIGHKSYLYQIPLHYIQPVQRQQRYPLRHTHFT